MFLNSVEHMTQSTVTHCPRRLLLLADAAAIHHMLQKTVNTPLPSNLRLQTYGHWHEVTLPVTTALGL